MKKRLISLSIALVMLLALVPAAFAEEPVEIKILAQIWEPYQEEQRAIFDVIEEKCNVKLNIEWAPRDGFAERVYTTIASGNLPDLISRMNINESSMIDEGAIVALDDYLQYAPNYVAAIGEDSASVRNAADGKLYAITSIVDISPAYCMALRTDWLENLGLEMPTTWDEWVNVWKAFRDNDANGNGDPNDEIPFTAAGEHISGFWGETPLVFLGIQSNQYFYLDGNTYQLVYDHPLYRDYLEMMQMLYSEHLLDQEVVTHTYQDTRSLQAAGTVGSALQFTDATTGAEKTLLESDPNAKFMAVAPIVGPNGNQLMPARARFDGRGFFATIQAEQSGKMEAIMKMVDYLFSEEGTNLVNYGVEGVHHTLVDNKPVYTDEMLDGGWTLIRQSGLANQTFILHWIKDAFQQVTTKNKAAEDMSMIEKIASDAFSMYDEYFFNIPPILATEAYSQYGTDLLTKTEELRAKCVTGEITVDEFFAQYEALKPLGLEEINTQAQEAWNKVNGL